MGRTVLYVEDDDAIRWLFAEALREAGFIVKEEKFAGHALKTLTRYRPDLILLDLGMPPGLMNGIDMLMRLRAIPDWLEIPVVVLSGLTDVVNHDVMANLNVANVLSKGTICGEELVRVVTDVVHGGPRST
jgi:CheY-like chemotaxis protein